MRKLIILTLSAVLAGSAAPALAASPPVTMMRDAREQVPPALLGAWKVEPAATGSAPARHIIQLRTFQYTAEGRLLVNFINISADGRQMIGHWALQIDGSPGYEFRSDNYSTPIAEIRFKKVDDFTFNLTNTVMGEVQATSVWKLSPDGKTLTATRSSTAGARTVTVYHKYTGR